MIMIREIDTLPLRRPLVLAAGDAVTMTYIEIDGVVRHERHTTIAVMAPSRQVTVDDAVLVETEINGRYAIGVLLLEQTQEEKRHEHPVASSAELRPDRRRSAAPGAAPPTTPG